MTDLIMYTHAILYNPLKMHVVGH